jgi:hypothetical protein
LGISQQLSYVFPAVLSHEQGKFLKALAARLGIQISNITLSWSQSRMTIPLQQNLQEQARQHFIKEIFPPFLRI